jgi:hypothetical protein
MKNSILILILLGLISFSCQNESKMPNLIDEKNNIKLNGLNDEHPNKNQMEWFLNNFQEEFLEDKKKSGTLEGENLIQKGYFFQTKLSDVSLSLFFCKNQQDALRIGESNFSVNNIHQKYGVNGAVLFVVEGKDKLKVNSVLSWFSGEE